MKNLLYVIMAASLLTACSEEGEDLAPSLENEVPTVQADSTFGITIEEDLVYAEGLSHDTRNSANATVMPLKLDVYVPDNDSDNRPAYLFIHGGGFTGGSKQQPSIVNLAEFYTSRGWVFISADYRLSDDKGTVPQEWLDYANSLDTLTSGQRDQLLAIYPAQRDAKAALRWVFAQASTYQINTDYVTIGGGSAGAITAISLGISEPEDFRDEITSAQDPTLASTNLDQSYQVQTIVDLWGSKVALDALQSTYGHQRFDRDDPPMFIAHGTQDPTVPFSSAQDLKTIYEAIGIPLDYNPIEQPGHGLWNVLIDGKRLEELAFDFIVEQQGLGVE